MENILQSGQLNGNSSMLTTLNPTVLLRSVAVLHHLLHSWRNRGTDTYSKVRQSIKEEKQHFLTHLHHLEPHTADLSCSPSSGYTHVHLWNCNLKRNPTNKPHKNGCTLQKGSVADGRLAAPLAAVPWQWKFFSHQVIPRFCRRTISPSLLLALHIFQGQWQTWISRQYPLFTVEKTGTPRWGIYLGALWLSEAFQLLSANTQHGTRGENLGSSKGYVTSSINFMVFCERCFWKSSWLHRVFSTFFLLFYNDSYLFLPCFLSFSPSFPHSLLFITGVIATANEISLEHVLK